MEIPMKAEEALRSRMKADALDKCEETKRKFAECTSSRTISIIWACRDELDAFNQCLSKHTSDGVLEQYKREWVDRGMKYEYQPK
eukprot:CAMPEP_0197844494 /NCGR_PEP_ID=MMETSP1438-20131217/1484_1 /TAXON_ID=1461541 /ORGANISM="Pterosperma sp., Strain CCMP1384" /LENGTH=84 /DNA_ID=CAMNT_0043455309 /DNA_START=203 /DNA_END=457 /DNA_ORIENTATION=+